ncbi:hypothetical protein JYS44_00405 [Phycisphaeraceae bacterium AH-315-B13]|nr:hypothetical protein [Phycisphaeraceae bacterium AH-315-B13]PHQ82954.1 MAG: hypothetical protein COB69_00055 [Phycisphaera sp.]
MIRRCAFTLFELLLAIALLTALVFTLLPASLRVMTSSAKAAERADRLSQIAILADVIDRSMLTLVAVDADGGPGFELSETSLKLVTCGVAVHADDLADADDLQTIEISHSGDRLRIKAGTGSWYTMLEQVERVEFSVFDGESWNDAGVMPNAVSVSVWFGTSIEPDDELPKLIKDEDRRDPDWRRVFAAFDPGLASEDVVAGR